VGSGTGVEVRRLATAVGPRGRAVGVEPHATLRAEAQRRAAGEGSAARFVDGEAEHLPFDDGSVDAVRSERVFQHLAEPEAAVAEIARVLRPDGRVVLLDTDWGTSVVHPADPDVLRRYHDAFRQNVAQPYAGRLLRTWLLRAGLEVAPVIGSSAVVLPDEVLRRPVLFMMNANAAVESGHLSREEADDLLAGVVEAAARGEAFGSVTMFGALARKPA
jgi:SAM-dependent methyltransferase